MTVPRVSLRGRHFANLGNVIIYPDLVVTRTGETALARTKVYQGYKNRDLTHNAVEG